MKQIWTRQGSAGRRKVRRERARRRLLQRLPHGVTTNLLALATAAAGAVGYGVVRFKHGGS